MDTTPSYMAVDKDENTLVYTDNMRVLVGTFIDSGYTTKKLVINALYSQGLKAAIRKAKTFNIEWIAN